jgi:RNA polymerase sigma-70 factor (ECF subfamily)
MEEQQQLVRLLASIALADRKAFAQLYELTSARLLGAGMRLLKRRELAEDVLQDVFVKVWHRAADYQPDRGSVMTWLHTIFRYQAFDRLRAMRPTQALSDDVTDVLAPAESDPFVSADVGSTAQRVHFCLDQLPEPQRRCIALAFYDGLSHNELTAKLDSPLGTIKSWIRRGLLALQRCLET